MPDCRSTPNPLRSRCRRGESTVILAALGLLAAACSGGGTNTPGTSASTSAGQPSSASAGTSVTVTLTEFAVGVPQRAFAPGTYTFTARNQGQTIHALEIVGPGGLDERTTTFRGGQSEDLTVTLQPGSYELLCPVGNHRQQGMTTTITVGGDSTAGSSPQQPTAGGY